MSQRSKACQDSRAQAAAFTSVEIADLAVQHRVDLVRYFLRRTSRTETAEDCAQETFARLARVTGRGEVRNPVGYMFRVASSVLKDRARRAKLRAASRHVTLVGDLHVSEEPGPERIVEARARLFVLKAVLDDLPAKTREIFLLNRLDGLSYSQLATRFGVSASAIEKHMMKAIAHLQRHARD